MEPITFSPAQLHVFNLVSHIKSDAGLEQLRQQLAAFYAKQVDDEWMLFGKAVNGMRNAYRSCEVRISARHTRSSSVI